MRAYSIVASKVTGETAIIMDMEEQDGGVEGPLDGERTLPSDAVAEGGESLPNDGGGPEKEAYLIDTHVDTE